MNSESSLTILLTLKNRTLFTNRWMNYANKIAFPFKVLIADGGCDESVSAMLRNKTRFPNVDFEYVRYSYDSTYSEYYAKIADALGRVRTPFVAMADNDDFFIADTMNEAVKFLSINPDYVSCGGQGAVFWVEPFELKDPGALLYGKNVDWKAARIHSIEGNTAKERIRSQALSSANPVYYDVTRIEHARKQSELARDLDFQDLFLYSDLIRFLTPIAGKTKRLDRLYIARQFNSPESSGEDHTKNFGNWFQRMLVESWSAEFTKFINSVADWLAAADGISIEEAKDWVISSYKMLLAPALLSDILDEPTITISMPIIASIVRRLVGLPEQSISKRAMRGLYRSFRWISLDAVYGHEIFGTAVPHSNKDFQPILEFLSHPS